MSKTPWMALAFSMWMLVAGAVAQEAPKSEVARSAAPKVETPKPDPMRQLDWLVGEWAGEASVQMGPKGRESVLQREVVTSKVGGQVLLIEGLGKRKLENGTAGDVVHDALALLSWDSGTKQFSFDPHVVGQPRTATTIDVTDGRIVWSFATPQGARIRYTIRQTDKGEWNEIGEFSRDGNAWLKFFDMTLQKVK